VSTTTSNPFDSNEDVANVGTLLEVEPTSDLEDAEAEAQLDLETDVDVDTPSEADEPETVVAPEKAKAKEKAPTRPPVPEGFVSPVAFAKILSAHLTEKARATNPTADAIDIAPQMVYSYMKNADPDKKGVKNPWPRYSSGGRENLLKVDESLAWWDAKDERVRESKATKAEKEAKKAAAAKAAEAPAVNETSGTIEEAE